MPLKPTQKSTLKSTLKPTLFSTFEVAATPVSNIVLVHGFAEHSGRYEHISNRLLQGGHSVARFDLRGYGKSSGPAAYVDDLSEYVDDLVEVATESMRRYPDLPLVLFGHSMGGLIVLRSILSGRLKPKAAILSSPALVFFEPAILQRASGLISRFLPRLPTVALERSLVSRDHSVVQAALNDPLCYQGKVKARIGGELIRNAKLVRDSSNQIELPVLIFHGGTDKLVNPIGSTNLYNAISSTDKTLKIYPESVHETLNDIGREEVEADIIDWLSSRF